jgi:hypothetical protein
MLFGQPDTGTAKLNPTTTNLQLHPPLREGGVSVSDFPPAVCAAAFISSATRAASSLSATATHLHPFPAPAKRHVCILALPACLTPRAVPLAGRGLDGSDSRTAHPVAQPSPSLLPSTVQTCRNLGPLTGPGPSSIASLAGTAPCGSMLCGTPHPST